MEGLEIPNFNFVASTMSGKAPGGDEKTGGALANILNSKDICSLDGDGDGQISNTEILGVNSLKDKLDRTHFSNANPIVVRSRDVGGGCFIRPKNCGRSTGSESPQSQSTATANR